MLLPLYPTLGETDRLKELLMDVLTEKILRKLKNIFSICARKHMKLEYKQLLNL